MGFYFGITLKSREVCADWAETQRIVRRTIRSIRAQGPDVGILLACHEEPELEDAGDVIVVKADWPVPRSIEEKKLDQFYKYFLLGMQLRTLGGGYFMAVDYDDLLSKNLLTEVKSSLDANGYLFSFGWVLDVGSGLVFPLPSFDAKAGPVERLSANYLLKMNGSFDLTCGTCGMFHFAPDELPSEPLAPCRFTTLFAAGHHKWFSLSADMGRPLKVVDRRLVAYVSGLADSVSVQAGESIAINEARRGWLRRALVGRSISPTFEQEFSYS